MFKKIKDKLSEKIDGDLKTTVSDDFYTSECAYLETKYLTMPLKYLNTKFENETLKSVEKYLKKNLDNFFYKNKKYFGKPVLVGSNIIEFTLFDLKDKKHLLKLPEKNIVVKQVAADELNEKKPFDPELDTVKKFIYPIKNMETPKKTKKKKITKKSLVKTLV